MSGSAASPLHVHVSRKTPVHVHLKEKPQKDDVAMKGSRRRPKRPVSIGRDVRSKSTLLTSTRSPWVPPPGKSSQPRMAWEGPTHRLEIHPPTRSRQKMELEGDREETVLRMSDLMREEEEEGEEEGEGEGGGRESVAATPEQSGVEERIKSLQSEVDTLKAKMEEEQLHPYQSLMSSRLQGQAEISPVRDQLLSKLAEVERESSVVSKHVEKVQDAVRKLGSGKGAASPQLRKQKAELQQRITDFKRGSKSLRKLLRSQQTPGVSVLVPPTPVVLSSSQPVQKREELALHTQGLHDEIGKKEVELQSLLLHTQSLEEQLQRKDQDYTELEASLEEVKRRAQTEKDALKRATRQHRDRAAHSERTVEMLGQQLEETTSELEKVRSKLTRAATSKIRSQTELSSLSTRVKELDECLTQSKITSQAALDAVGARLTERTQELNAAQLENERLRTNLSEAQTRLRTLETTTSSKITALEAELSQTRATSSQYEGLSEEYKTQLEKTRKECDDLQRELRRKELELERQQQEGTLELERYRMKTQQQLAELEPLPELLKASEMRLRETEHRLSVCEQRTEEQSQLVQELTSKCEQQAKSLEVTTEKWHEATAETKSLLTRLDTAERRMQESDQQSRELVTITSKKEESIQKLQSQLEECRLSISSLNSQLESSQSESRRQLEHIKDKAASKERAHIARTADLETQLSKANRRISQLCNSKEETERQHQSKVSELQGKLDRATSSLGSMENYISLLKGSYAALCTDHSDKPISPLHHTLH